TEIPSILVLCTALTVHLRGLRRHSAGQVILGALLLGLGVNIRESLALFGAWLALAPFVCGWNRKGSDLYLTLAACGLFLICALGPFAVWFALNLGGYRDWWWGWIEASRREAALYPMSLETFRFFFRWFFKCSPLALVLTPFALWNEGRQRGVSPLFLMGALGLAANLFLIVHYSSIFHGRYFLTGLPAMAPLVADFVMRSIDRLKSFLEHDHALPTRPHLGLVAGATLIVAIGIGNIALAWPSQHAHQLWSLRWKNYRQRLEEIPRQNVAVITSGMTNAVGYWSAVTGANRSVIGCGTGWPGDDKLVAVVADYLRQGKQVFIDADSKIWSKDSHETYALRQLQNHFRFREITDTIYEICPRDDLSAIDDPQLETLSRHSWRKSFRKIP